MRYPIGIQTFEKIIEGKFAYVDKTDLVYNLAQENICFLSRPRRFGKSLLVSMLEAYFLGKKELFEGLKIDTLGLEKDWESYTVFRIDFATGNFNNTDELSNTLDGLLVDWEQLYCKDTNKKTFGERFRYILEQAHKKTGKKAVVLIDEYDKPLLDVLGDEQENINRNILKGFYGTFKAADAHLRFVFLTGVTKFSQITVFSGFNQPKDISMDSRYDAICGITEEELHSVFAEPIHTMAETLGHSDDEMKAVLKKHYDGYHFSSRMVDIYNPFSIINALDKMEIYDYWYASGTPTYLAALLQGHHVNLQKLLSKEYRAKYFVDYRADYEEPLAMLYQSGYVTIKNYSSRDGLYTLDFPNDEVRSGFSTLTANLYFGTKEEDFDNWVFSLNRMLRKGDLEGVMAAYTSFLASIPYEADKDLRALDYETHFQYTFYIINRLLSCYTVLIEKQNSHGRADIIIESDHDVYIFEFKIDKPVDEALAQIEEKGYATPYVGSSKIVHKIGVSISSSTRTVVEWKENVFEVL